ncbi:hypothetical protein BJQ97_00863 [Geobacillus sp. TFV-3]|nr:hypothetical protein BJQ97_00863 [Geobacillus sp. TFV-3]
MQNREPCYDSLFLQLSTILGGVTGTYLNERLILVSRVVR